MLPETCGGLDALQRINRLQTSPVRLASFTVLGELRERLVLVRGRSFAGLPYTVAQGLGGRPYLG